MRALHEESHILSNHDNDPFQLARDPKRENPNVRFLAIVRILAVVSSDDLAIVRREWPSHNSAPVYNVFCREKVGVY
ncbi:hypothetical protein TNCT_529431 [Trichonephila clavata]|uniref:Uncharacterized protein n=1 Tax=Trichonephila clavata TaxID=2740835 RepID=A0A8X6HPV0_TRICU|nr:hypothetical protein TNCT_529431 [Trichonephila clavata]